MARIWSEPGSGANYMLGVPKSPATEAAARVHGSLSRSRVIFVRVCSFTFQFSCVEELRASVAFYSKKIHPSRRSSEVALAVRSGEVLRWEAERWHERLPLYLREEPKRVRVLAALQRALRKAEDGKI